MVNRYTVNLHSHSCYIIKNWSEDLLIKLRVVVILREFPNPQVAFSMLTLELCGIRASIFKFRHALYSGLFVSFSKPRDICREDD